MCGPRELSPFVAISSSQWRESARTLFGVRSKDRFRCIATTLLCRNHLRIPSPRHMFSPGVPKDTFQKFQNRLEQILDRSSQFLFLKITCNAYNVSSIMTNTFWGPLSLLIDDRQNRAQCLHHPICLFLIMASCCPRSIHPHRPHSRSVSPSHISIWYISNVDSFIR